MSRRTASATDKQTKSRAKKDDERREEQKNSSGPDIKTYTVLETTYGSSGGRYRGASEAEAAEKALLLRLRKGQEDRSYPSGTVRIRMERLTDSSPSLKNSGKGKALIFDVKSAGPGPVQVVRRRRMQNAEWRGNGGATGSGSGSAPGSGNANATTVPPPSVPQLRLQRNGEGEEAKGEGEREGRSESTKDTSGIEIRGGRLVYQTANFEISYPNYVTEEPHPVCEMYLFELYNRFKEQFLSLVRENDILTVTEEEDPVKYRHKLGFTRDILSYFTLHNYTNSNPFFSDNPDYDVDSVEALIGSEYDDAQKDRLQRVLLAMEERSKAYFRQYEQRKESLRTMQYQHDVYKDEEGNVVIKLIPFEREVVVKKSIFMHLVKMYNMANFNDYERPDPINVRDFYDKVFVLYNRYYAFDSGNNQSSILPVFKKVLKKYLNIKVELFGSAINTSNRFASLFYDIEKYFGSMGNFFNLDIKKGYYEVNPPYENTIIGQVFLKMSEWLSAAQGPLLFFVILPKRDYRSFDSFKKLAPFVRKIELIPKERFPFLRYDRQLVKSRISPIVDVVIMIIHNDRIDPVNKTIASNWDTNARFNLRQQVSQRNGFRQRPRFVRT